MKFDIEFTTGEKIDITTAYAQFLVNRGERSETIMMNSYSLNKTRKTEWSNRKTGRTIP